MEIELPDGTILEAPDGADIRKVVQGYNRSLAPKAPNPAQQAARQAFENSRQARLNPQEPQRQLRPAMSPFDVPADVGMSVLSSMVAAPASGIAGLFGGADAVEKIGHALAYQPRTIEGQKASQAIAYPFEKLAQLGDYAGGAVAEASGSPALGAGVNTAIQAVPALFLRGRGTRTVGRGVEAPAGKPKGAPATTERPARLGDVPPTIEELGAQSRAAYKRASDAGANITPGSFNNLKNRINVTLKSEGLDPTLHPQTTAALKRINGTKGQVSLDQLETLRKIANDARGGVNKADSRLAGKIVDELDGYTENISRKDLTTGDPKAFEAVREGRDLWSRKAKAEEIAELVRRAEISAPNFSASGMENALRTEFRSLAKNKNRMRRFNAEERAAIEKVAKGGPLENALRMLGKFAPNGVVSTALSGGAGFVLGGPAGAAGLPAVGAAARYGATRMTQANVRAAEELMRRGQPRKPRKTQPANALIDQ